MSKEILHNEIGTAFLITRNDGEAGVEDKRAFFSSKNVDIFPCSRRGQQYEGKPGEYESNPVKVYDPEARLNTERTNRLRTAINGFKESFIYSFDSATNKLIFVLAGYRVEVRNIDLNLLADKLLVSNENILYAHLSLHDNVSLIVEDYFTEILYRQSTEANDANSLDVNVVTDDSKNNAKFFVGISFTNNPNCKDSLADSNRVLAYHNLPIFKMDKLGDDTWQSELIQTSLLPKIEHGETENSVKIPGDSLVDGDFTVKHIEDDGNLQTTFSVTKDKTTLGLAEISSLIVGEKAEEESFPAKGMLIAKTSIETPILNVTNSAKNAKADIDELVADKATIGDLEVKADPTLNDSTGKITAVNVQATVDITAPQLRVNRITSDDDSITIDNKKLIVNKNLEMLAKESATDPANATIEQAVIGDLTVKEDLKLKNSTGKITAKEVAAEKIIQNSRSIPYIKMTNNNQLQIWLDGSDSRITEN